MATAKIVGIVNIGGTLVRDLIRSGESVVLAANDEANAAALAQELGDLARAASVEEAIAQADAAVFAVWLDTIKELRRRTWAPRGLGGGHPSDPIGVDENRENALPLRWKSFPSRDGGTWSRSNFGPTDPFQ